MWAQDRTLGFALREIGEGFELSELIKMPLKCQKNREWKSEGALTTNDGSGWGEGVGRVMEACEHHAEDLRLCPGTLQAWRIVGGGSESSLVLGRFSWSPCGEWIRRGD